jgi:hypothetical protein
MTTWKTIDTEFGDQQTDLPNGLWAQIGPASTGGWSWAVFDFDRDNDRNNIEMSAGTADDEASAKAAVDAAAAALACPCCTVHVYGGACPCCARRAVGLSETERCADELAAVVRRFFPFGDDGSFEVERALARYQARRALR